MSADSLQNELQQVSISGGNSSNGNDNPKSLNRTKSKSSLQTIGNYIVGQKIGEGTFGKVMLARHKATNKKVALKIIEVKSPSVQRNLERESRIMKLLSHPHIVQLYEVIDLPERNATCLVLEFVEGGELFDYIINKEKLDEKEAVKFFRQMLSAVEYCHANLVVHRDLKPENILLDSDKNVKIMDFGLANMMNLKDFLHTNCGSPIYCAPEILYAREYIGPEVDVWALGVILYVMVTGCCPWSGRTLQDQIKKAQIGLYDNIDGIVSKECANLVARILTTDAKKRPTTAEIWQHPWVTQGLTQTIQPITTQRKPATFIDQEVVKQMCETWGFDKLEIINDVLSNKSVKQTYVLYYLMLENKKKNNRPTLNRQTSASKFPTWDGSEKSEDTEEPRGRAITQSLDESDLPSPQSPINDRRNEVRGSAQKGLDPTSPRKESFLATLFKSKKGAPGGPASPEPVHRERRLSISANIETSLVESKSKNKLHTVKGQFALDKVSHKSPDEISKEIERVLIEMKVPFALKRPYKYSCKLEEFNPVLKLDLEICQIEKSDGKGIRMKRKSGTVWNYKETAMKITAALNI